MTSAGIGELAGALDRSIFRAVGEERGLAVALYQALAEGRPVREDELARRVSLPVDRVASALDGWPGVFREDGAIVGFWGLALPGMSHGFEVNGRELSTWCAWDPLFIAPLLGADARVRSTCPATGEAITLTVGPDGVRDLSPAGAVVSFVVPDEAFGDDVLTSFCHHVWYFASEEAGRSWIAEHPGTLLLSVDEAFELGRRVGPLREP